MDKIIVITGGTSGIGLDLKNLFVNNGDKVLTVSSRELDDENHYSCDITNELKVKQVINDIGTKFGKIDILINCAGCGMSGITELVPTEQIEKINNVNYYGTLYTIRSAIRFMQTGGKIVNVSSAMALFPLPFRGIYGASKSAVLNLTFSLRMELKPLGIDVVAFCPGDVKTNFTANRIKDEQSNERYGNRLQSATDKLDSKEDKRISSIKCATAMFKLISKQKCKPFYIIGGKYKFLYFLTRITPKAWLLNITGKLYGGRFEEDKKSKNKEQPDEEVNNIDASQMQNQELQEEVHYDSQENISEETQSNGNPFANILNKIDDKFSENVGEQSSEQIDENVQEEQLEDSANIEESKEGNTAKDNERADENNDTESTTYKETTDEVADETVQNGDNVEQLSADDKLDEVVNSEEVVDKKSNKDKKNKKEEKSSGLFKLMDKIKK